MFGNRLDDRGVATWRARLQRAPHRYAAQAQVLFATTPVLAGGVIEPGTAVIRAQVTASPDGYQALFHAVEHMAYHTGQIVLLAKALAPPGTEIDFYPQHRGE